jgi:hypothetical protein
MIDRIKNRFKNFEKNVENNNNNKTRSYVVYPMVAKSAVLFLNDFLKLF